MSGFAVESEWDDYVRIFDIRWLDAEAAWKGEGKPKARPPHSSEVSVGERNRLQATPLNRQQLVSLPMLFQILVPAEVLVPRLLCQVSSISSLLLLLAEGPWRALEMATGAKQCQAN